MHLFKSTKIRVLAVAMSCLVFCTWCVVRYKLRIEIDVLHENILYCASDVRVT